MIDVELNMRITDKDYSTLLQLESLVDRVSRTSKELRDKGYSKDVVDNLRLVISDIENINKLVPVIKLMDDKATEIHNKIFDKDETKKEER